MEASYLFTMDKQAAELLLKKRPRGIGFSVTRFGIKWHFRIRPLLTETVMDSGYEVCQMKDIDSESYVFREMMEKSQNLRHIIRVIVIATETRFPGLAYHWIKKVDLDNLAIIWGAVIKYSNPTAFFFIMESAKGLNKIRTAPAKQ